MTPSRFRQLVYSHHARAGRHDLPWRKTKNPYRILVSEIMLQQTQVERVIPFYRAFLTDFPTLQALAEAPLAAVLVRWQGLGYNRRAKMLHEAAKIVVRDYKGVMPKDVRTLESLPGIGHYTARAVAAFAHNTDVIFIETNVRTAVTHHFFPGTELVSDKEVIAILEKVYPTGDARRWYSALMDYGTHLKRSGVRINARAKNYTKQSTFRGSDREVRGGILRALAKKPQRASCLHGIMGDDRKPQVRVQLERLVTEGLVEKTGGLYRLPGFAGPGAWK